jgi:hypothetical protein
MHRHRRILVARQYNFQLSLARSIEDHLDAAARYGLNACALVPHMVFLVDFVARGLGQGIATGSNYWVFYGLGATLDRC